MEQIKRYTKGIGVLFAFALVAILGVYVFFILYHAEWLIGDDAFMLRRTAFGIPFPFSESILPEMGFFRPFDYLHENIVLLFHSGMHSAFEHYIINAVSFVVCMGALTGVLWMTVKPKDVTGIAIIFFGVILVASRLIGIYINVFGPIFGVYTYHMLAVLFLCLFLENDKVWAMLMSLFCWAYSMLIYENVCLVLGCMGFFPLAFCYKSLSKKQVIYCFSLIGLACLFLLAYFVVIVLPTIGQTHYDPAHNTGVGMMENAVLILSGQKFLWVAGLVWGWRQIQLIRKRSTYHVLYDTLLWAAGGVVVGAVILRLNWSMYYYDAIVLSLPAVVFFVMQGSVKYGKYVALCLMILFAIWHSWKVPSTISSNQENRVSTSKNMNLIARKALDGWPVVWFDDKELEDAEEIQKNWKKGATRSYLQFLLKDRDWDYSGETGNQSIVFCPIENNLEPDICAGSERIVFGGVSYYIVDRDGQ